MVGTRTPQKAPNVLLEAGDDDDDDDLDGDGDGEFDESLSFRATTRSSRDESTDMIREGEREFFEGV